MDPYTEGYLAFDMDRRFRECPYPDGSEDAEQWQAGWIKAKSDNGHFGVGA